MASMQCYRSVEEECQTKRHNNSFGQKVSEMASKVFHGNHHDHHRPNHDAESETKIYYSETQTYYPDQYGAMGKTQSAHCAGQFGHSGSTHHVMGMGYGSGHHMGQQMSHGMSDGCHEKKMINNCEFKKKKNHFGKKHRDGNRSCSESESDSDCD